jgi:hypothetical protein
LRGDFLFARRVRLQVAQREQRRQALARWTSAVAVLGACVLAAAAASSGAKPLAASYDLQVTIAADSPSATIGGRDGYTVTIQNSTAGAAEVDRIRFLLPGHGGNVVEEDIPGDPVESKDTSPAFRYLPGSTTGLTTADPTVIDRWLVWPGTLVAAGSTVSLHFGVTVSSIPAYYSAGATVDAEGLSVLGTRKSTSVHVACLPDFCFSLTVDPTDVHVGDVVTYTGSIRNDTANATSVTLTRVAGVPGVYVAGSSRGALSSDASQQNTNLYWSQSFAVPRRATTRFSFDLKVTLSPRGAVAVQARIYLAQPVDGYTVVGTGPTAHLHIHPA